MTDINLLKKSLSRRGMRPALDEKGEPFLTRTATTPGISFISTEQLVDEYAKRGKVIHDESLEITEAPRPQAAAPKATEEPAPLKNTIAPTPAAPVVNDTWTLEELAKKTRPQLQTLAKKHDIPANHSSDDIRNALTGKPKKLTSK
jgi:hypothetical protein